MPSLVKIGVIGLGRMGRLYARMLASRVSGVHLDAVAEVSEQAQSQIMGELDIAHAFADAYELLALPDLDAVVIATPTSTHHDLVIAAAKAGKAIFCEKPLALTLEENRSMLQAVASAQVPLQVGFMRRFDAAYQRAKTLIVDGQIGHPVTFKSLSRDPFCPPGDYMDPAKSGGLILDMAIHDFDYDIRTEVLGSEGAVMIGVHQHTPVLLLNRAGAHHDVMPYLMERFGDAYRAQLQHFVDCLHNGQSPAVGGAEALAACKIGIAATRSYQAGRPVTLSELETSSL